MMKTLDIPVDAPTPHDYGRIVSNLAMLKMNAVGYDAAKWEALLDHVTYPDDNPFPEGLFLLPKEELYHYNLLLGAMDNVYDKFGS
jgi:hypothetical protein